MQSNQVNANTGHRFICKTPDITPGLILHPSFGCSALVGTDSTLVMLIMGNSSKPITPEKINVHLKIMSWGNEVAQAKHTMLEDERYGGFQGHLFGNRTEARNNIKCDKITLSDIMKDSNGKYAFIPEPKVIQSYKDKGYTDLYRVEINLTSLVEEGYYNLFWINQNKEKEDEIVQQRMDHFFGTRILKYLHNGKFFWYGFDVNSNSMFFDRLNLAYPICSYHPMLYKKKPFFNIALLGDLHLSSKQELLKKSRAKVIEADDIQPIGDLLNDSFDNTRDLLVQAGNDPNIDMVLVAGDIIDFLKAFYPVDFFNRANTETTLDNYYDTQGKIWQAVGIDNRSQADMKYQDCVDLITFYSLMLNFYETYKKPIYVIGGNHDAYYYGYGVSPRVSLLGIEIKRANEGVPADMNMTIYESILTYGEHYDDITEYSIFREEKIEIFYSLFTPMKDFSLILPDFTLTGLSWGDEEDSIDVSLEDDQGLGHLPRSDDAVSDEQMQIVDYALEKNKKNILLSHFTFVSYHEQKQLFNSEEGELEFDTFGRYDMGTFETNREKIYQQYLATEKKLHYVLTGHSHRRGLYEVTESVKSRFYDFSHFNQINGPKIIVTDSAGCLPRYNYYGEFKGWGSIDSTFTKIVFREDGELRELRAVKTRNPKAKARFAVAMDYLYIIEDTDFIDKCESQEIPNRSYMRATDFVFKLELEEDLEEGLTNDLRALNIAEMSIYYYSGGVFQKVPVQCSKKPDNTIECRIHFPDLQSAERFKTYACDCGRTVFASVKFSPMTGLAFSHYDYSSPYNFEIRIKKHHTGLFGLGSNTYLTIDRDDDYNEIPDLEWRINHYPNKYATA